MTLEGDGCAASRRGRLLDGWSLVQYLSGHCCTGFFYCDATIFVVCICDRACRRAVTASGVTGISCDCTFLRVGLLHFGRASACNVRVLRCVLGADEWRQILDMLRDDGSNFGSQAFL